MIQLHKYSYIVLGLFSQRENITSWGPIDCQGGHLKRIRFQRMAWALKGYPPDHGLLDSPVR